jgi:hypothetical protein
MSTLTTTTRRLNKAQQWCKWHTHNNNLLHSIILFLGIDKYCCTARVLSQNIQLLYNDSRVTFTFLLSLSIDFIIIPIMDHRLLMRIMGLLHLLLSICNMYTHNSLLIPWRQ